MNQDNTHKSPDNPAKSPKTCGQILGGVFALVGTLTFLFGALRIFSVLWDLVGGDFEWSRLLGSLIAMIVGFPVMTFGYWLYTPKALRGRYKLFYDPPKKN